MPLDLLAIAETFAQPRAARARAAGTGEPRKPSLATRCLDWIVAQVDATDTYGRPLPLNDLVKAWCANNYPAQAGRETPDATIESQLRVRARAGTLPPGVTIVTARDRKSQGLPARAAIVVDAR